MWQEPFREFLQKDFKDLQKRNPRFSLRSYSSRLKVSPSIVSNLLAGKYYPSSAKALLMLQRTSLKSEKSKQKIIDLIQNSTRPPLVLKPQDYDVLFDWKCLGILGTLELTSPPRTAPEIAARLGMNTNAIKSSLNRLLTLGLVAMDGNQHYSLSNRLAQTSDQIPSESIRDGIKKSLKKAAAAIDKIPISERDMTQVVFVGNKAKLPEAQKLIRKFYQQLIQLLGNSNKDEIFQVSVQLYPLSKLEKDQSID